MENNFVMVLISSVLAKNELFNHVQYTTFH